MALNKQQQIIIAPWAITYHNDCEALRQMRHDFNLSLQPSILGKWRKRLPVLEMGSIHKGKPSGRPLQ